MQRRLLKIYGERNTGTNYLSELIRLNLNVELLAGIAPEYVQAIQKVLPGNELIRDLYFYFTFSRNLGWKHSLVKSPDILKKIGIVSPDIGFVTITKNPYSWLLSLYNKPYHQKLKSKLSFEEFLSTKWKTVGRENGPMEYLNPVELWNKKNASYIALSSEFKTLNLKYENILSNPKEVISLISSKFDLDVNVGGFVNVIQSTKESDKNYSHYQAYYLSEAWREKLSECMTSIINQSLDDNVMNYYSYQRI